MVRCAASKFALCQLAQPKLATRALLACFRSSGLSPPTRGSRRSRPSPQVVLGSIPAHAGEPPTEPNTEQSTAVYPRPRGGAFQPIKTSERIWGLSPPTRGSLSPDPVIHRDPGSIPAHAGEPWPSLDVQASDRVYPRPRGGAPCNHLRDTALYGLSPPTRGSRAQLGPPDLARRSIPAHAGEPVATYRAELRGRVYPRPRGGAASSPLACVPFSGLSPPTRGSLLSWSSLPPHPRSIPAHAGEPVSVVWRSVSMTVYPRPRGGALSDAWTSSEGQGLSPPTRGSRAIVVGQTIRLGSIPAHAGEPRTAGANRCGNSVYPRPRGGASR